jgi:hypothetical protein
MSGDLDTIWKGLPVHCNDFIAIHIVAHTSDRVPLGTVRKKAPMLENDDIPSFR